jgi:hypothetical protein
VPRERKGCARACYPRRVLLVGISKVHYIEGVNPERPGDGDRDSKSDKGICSSELFTRHLFVITLKASALNYYILKDCQKLN